MNDCVCFPAFMGVWSDFFLSSPGKAVAAWATMCTVVREAVAIAAARVYRMARINANMARMVELDAERAENAAERARSGAEVAAIAARPAAISAVEAQSGGRTQ